tara:strand:- start:5 stop:520 length:516 start_codon:yes stop_codon:yes gene_type:complete
MLSKKMYYSYLLNFIDEYWRNIYLKFREKIRKTSMLVMTINNVLYKAHIKANRTIQTERITQTEHITHTTRTSRPSSDTRRLLDTELLTNKAYDNLMNLVIKIKAKSDKIFIYSIKKILANAAYKSENKQIKHKGTSYAKKLIAKNEKQKQKDKTKTKKTKAAQLPSIKLC